MHSLGLSACRFALLFQRPVFLLVHPDAYMAVSFTQYDLLSQICLTVRRFSVVSLVAVDLHKAHHDYADDAAEKQTSEKC